MWGKLFEVAIKAAFSTGLKEYQKGNLKKTASNNGEILATIRCSLRRTNQIMWQEGRVVVTKSKIYFGAIGKIDLLNSNSEEFPIDEISFNRTTYETLMGAVKQEAIELYFKNKKYLFVFPNGKRDLFEEAISKS